MANDKTTVLTDLKDKFLASVEHETWKKFVGNATTDFEFKENIQLSNDEIAELKKRGQPPTVENEIHPIVERIMGQYVNQKTRIIFKGRNLGPDEMQGNILSDLALHVQQQTGYEFEEMEMFHDGQICGFGVAEVYITYEKDLSPKINIKADNSLNFFPDPNSKKYDWNEDADFVGRAKWVSYKEAIQRYREYKKEIQGFINHNPVTNDSQTMERNHLIDERLKRIRLVEVWYKDWKKRTLAIAKGIGVQDVTDYTKKQLKELEAANPDIRYDERVEAKMRVGIFCGETLLEDKESPYEHNLFPFVPYFVYRRKNGEPYSYVRLLKDPNMEINKRRSKALHLLNTNQAVYEEGAVRDDDELRTEMAKPDGLIKYRKGFQFEIQRNVDLAAAQLQLQMESKTAIARISGVSDEAMARHSEVRSGIGLQRKQLMTDIIMSPIFNNLRRSRLMIGKLIHELIKQFYTEEKVFYVLDDMNKPKEIILNAQGLKSIQEGIYDIIVEEAPNVATIQEEQFAYLAELVKGLNIPANVGIAMLPIFVRLSQLKNKDEVVQMLEQLQQLPPEHPKMSLSLAWTELYPEEKAFFAQIMGSQELAQFEIQAGGDPAHVTKAKVDIQKAAMSKEDPEIERENAMTDLQMKEMQHEQKMRHGEQQHGQKMMQTDMAGRQKMEQMAMQQSMMQERGNESRNSD